METKLSKLRTAMAANDWHAALRIAARFQRLGEHTEPITRAWAAMTNRAFYEQLGHDPDSLVSAGIAALKSRYP